MVNLHSSHVFGEMEREARNHYYTRGSGGGGVAYNHRGEPDLLLQWGSRKRLRCVKVQRRDDGCNKPTAGAVVSATTIWVDRRVVRANNETGVPTRHRVLRNNSEAMRTQQQQVNVGATATTSAAEDNKKGGAEGSSSGSEEAVWPKFAIALTNKEKEEDFLVFKGSKLPQRPKKRPKLVQRTLNLVCPGTWLCDLTVERYEVREKKVSKKKPRGLKAMGNMESDSE